MVKNPKKLNILVKKQIVKSDEVLDEERVLEIRHCEEKIYFRRGNLKGSQWQKIYLLKDQNLQL